MIQIEAVHYPIDYARYKDHIDGPREKLIKLGLAVVVLDQENNILLVQHEGRDRNFPQGVWGPPTETLKPVPERAENLLESPLEVSWRCLQEELPASQEQLQAAQLYFSRDSILEEGRWNLGEYDGVLHYVLGFTLQMRVMHPDKLLTDGFSDETIDKKFFPLDDVLKIPEKKLRPGVRGWYESIQHHDFFHSPNSQPIIMIESMQLPSVGAADIRFDGVI